MHPTLRNVIGLVIGTIAGHALNGLILNVSGSIIPYPEGFSMKTMEDLQATIPLCEPKHYIFPFLAHALGTFAAALITVWIAATRRMQMALSVGAIFLMAGIYMVVILPAPLWFEVLDLILAYIPMAWMAGKLRK